MSSPFVQAPSLDYVPSSAIVRWRHWRRVCQRVALLFGSDVSLSRREALPRLVPNDEARIAALDRAFRKRGIKAKTGTTRRATTDELA